MKERNNIASVTYLKYAITIKAGMGITHSLVPKNRDKGLSIKGSFFLYLINRPLIKALAQRSGRFWEKLARM